MFEEMRKSVTQQTWPIQPLPTTQYANIAPAVPQKRSFSEQEIPYPPHRPLQPRLVPRNTDSPVPSVTNGESPVFIRSLPVEPGPEQPKKRGRPSKAEVEERDRQLALEGKVYQPKKRPAKKPRPSTDPAALELKLEDVAPAPLLQTTPTRPGELREESSSGKRRSRRQTKDDAAAADPTPSREMQDLEQSVAESPSDRLLASRDREFVVSGAAQRRTSDDSESISTEQRQ